MFLITPDEIYGVLKVLVVVFFFFLFVFFLGLITLLAMELEAKLYFLG